MESLFLGVCPVVKKVLKKPSRILQKEAQQKIRPVLNVWTVTSSLEILTTKKDLDALIAQTTTQLSQNPFLKSLSKIT